MLSTGIVRKLDKLGRIVLPKEIRDGRSINPQTALEIFTEGNTIILRLYEPGCSFCGSMDSISYYNQKAVCASCKSSLENL